MIALTHQPLTDAQEREIRDAACDADRRPHLERVEAALLAAVDASERDARQARKNAEFIRRCLDKAPGIRV